MSVHISVSVCAYVSMEVEHIRVCMCVGVYTGTYISKDSCIVDWVSVYVCVCACVYI